MANRYPVLVDDAVPSAPPVLRPGTVVPGGGGYHDIVASGPPSGPAGGDLAGNYPNPTLAVLGAGIGPLGTASRTPTVTVDTKGRVTALTDQAIAIAQSQVANLTTDLSARVLKAGDTMTGLLVQKHGMDFSQVAAPVSGTLTVALAGVGAGNVDNGTHQYYCSFVTVLGETELGRYAVGGYGVPITVVDKTTNGQVLVTFPVSADSRVTGRRLYRSGIVNGYTDVRLIASIAENVSTTWTDNLADAGKTGLEAFYKDNTTNLLVEVDGVTVMKASSLNTLLGLGANNGLFSGVSIGGYNTTIGYRTGFTLTTGTRNTVLGYAAGYPLTTGFDNTIIGDSAGLSNQTGYASVLIGRNVNGTHNGTRFCTYIGNYVNGGGSTGQQTANVALGHQALYGLTTGGSSIAIGAYANQNQTAFSGCIVIGAYCDVPSAALHGQLNIGNVLYGLGLYTTTSSSSTPTSLGKIGIGLTTPTAVLHLKAGTATAGTAPLKLNSGPLLTAPEAGALEFLTDILYATITTGAARKRINLYPLIVPEYDDATLPASRAANLGAAPPNYSSTEMSHVFRAGAAMDIDVSFEPGHGYAEGTAVELHVHVHNTTNGAGNVRYIIKHRVVTPGLAVPAFTTDAAAVYASGSTLNAQIVTLKTLASATATIGSVWQFNIQFARNNAADTYGGDVFVSSYGVHYQRNTLGSQTVSGK